MRSVRRRCIPKGAVLFVAGQPSRGVIILSTRRAKLTLTSPRGQSVIVGIVGRGNVLGLEATLSRVPHQVSAETLEPTQANFLPAAQLT